VTSKIEDYLKFFLLAA